MSDYSIKLVFLGPKGEPKSNPLSKTEIYTIETLAATVCRKANANMVLFFTKKDSRKYEIILYKEGEDERLCSKHGKHYLETAKKVFQAANKSLNAKKKRRHQAA